jgi:hypothetical protein
MSLVTGCPAFAEHDGGEMRAAVAAMNLESICNDAIKRSTTSDALDCFQIAL